LIQLKNTHGLIIDVRNNSGGVSLTYDYVLARFIQTPVKETVYFKDGSYESWWIEPATTVRYEEHIVILLNGASFSAAEIFTDLMQQLPEVTVIGDTSGGGGGAAQKFKLPDGKQLRLPVKYFKRRDGRMIEWNGIVPDVVVQQSEADLKNRHDKQLERAVQWLKEN